MDCLRTFNTINTIALLAADNRKYWRELYQQVNKTNTDLQTYKMHALLNINT